MFKPTALIVVLVVLELAAQFIFFSSRSTSMDVSGSGVSQYTMQSSLGIGGPISVTKEGMIKSVHINWTSALVNAALTYIVACLLARALTGATHFHRPATVYATAALTMVGISFLISIAISNSYWGYPFDEPKLLREAGDIAKVRAITPIKTETNSSGSHAFVVDNGNSISNMLAVAERYPDDCLSERLVIELQKKNLIPSNSVATIPELSQFYSEVRISGLMAHSDKGYASEQALAGVAVDGVNQSGARVVFLAITGGQLSNDHYPYYELLFGNSTDGTTLSFNRGQRFFYDAAGLEGFGWLQIWMLISIPCILLGFILLTAARFVSRRWRKKIPATFAVVGM